MYDIILVFGLKMEYACARIYYLSNSCAIIASIVNSLAKINQIYIQSQTKSCPSSLILPNIMWEDITLKCEDTYIFYIFFYCGPPLSLIIHLVYLGIGCNAAIGYLFHNVLQFALKFVPFCSLLARFFFLYLECC